MTVSTPISRIQYATNGVTTAFPITFIFFDDSTITAAYTDSLGVVTTLVLTTDYTITGGDGETGTLTTVSTLASGGTVTIYRVEPYTQTTDFTENDPLPAEDLERVADKAAMRDQQLADAAERSLSFPPTIDPSVSALLPDPLADAFLAWNASGTALINQTISTGAVVFASISTTSGGTSTTQAVNPAGLHGSIYNCADMIVEIFGEAVAVATGAGKRTFRMIRKGTLLALTGGLTTAQASGTVLTVDVNKNGTTIYTTQGNRPSIAISGVTNKSAAPDVQAWADGEYLTVDVDQIGSTIAGGGPLTVTVVCE